MKKEQKQQETDKFAEQEVLKKLVEETKHTSNPFEIALKKAGIVKS